MLVFSVICFGQDNGFDNNKDDGKMLFSVTREKSSPKNILIGLNFKNISDSDIKLFGDSKLMDMETHVFFSINATFNDGQSFSTPTGTLEISEDGYAKYRLIKKGKTYKKVIDLKKVFDSFNFIPPEDSFTLKVTYSNQYGPDDCIKGQFDAAEIEILTQQ